LHSNSIKKNIHHAINVTSTEAELFAIRCRINQAVQIPDVSHIIVITDAIHSVRHMFDSITHPNQIQSIVIVQDLKMFFNKYTHTLIDFQNCQSNTK